MDWMKRWIMKVMAAVMMLVGSSEFSKFARQALKESAKKAIERILP